MPVKRKLRRYISNIISFANSRIKNSLRDRSEEFYAGDVTPELVDLMRRVWQPIVGLDREILVVRFHKPKNASSLGVSLQGITQVPDIPSSTHVPQSDSGKMDENTDQAEWGVPRHFVLSVLPSGPVGKLKVVQPGDELLQVNGRRLHGSSHTSTVRCLRNLPNYIELVLARSRSPSSLDQYAPPVDGDRINFDSPPIELIGSEVGSVDTALSADHQDMTVPLRLHQPSNSLSPGTTKRRVSDWIRRSQGDLRPEDNIAGPHAEDFIDSARIKRVHSLNLEPRKLAPVTSSPAASRQTESNHTTLGDVSGSLPYDQPQQQLGETKRSGVHHQQSASIRMSEDLTSSTIPIYGTYRRSRDPRYGHKRPVWADVPLLVQLTKSSRGFGFSLSEYEELPVSETDQRVRRKTLTLGRRSSSRRSNYSDRLNRSASLPRSYSRQGKRVGGHGHGVLLIDSLIPGGAAERDGRISVGDRLLFLNDRNLAKSSLREAAAALRAAPNGPCLLGIAKMHLEPNEPEVLPYLPSLIQPITMTSASAVGSFDHSRTSADYDSLIRPLQVNTGGDVMDGYQDIPAIDSAQDHPLDFHVLPSVTINFGLHAHQLNVPPVASEEEKSGQIPLLSSPIGIKLDALAAGGQDGCRIIQILDGGAVKQSGLLGVNDYVTSMNGHNMRGITNMEAFQILRLLSLDSQIIDTKFFPAEVILAHRSRFAQETEEPLIVPVAPNGLITTTTTTEAADSSAPEFIPPVSLLNHIESSEWWLNSEKVILRRKPGEHTWGLQLSGDLPPPLLPNTPLPPLNRPTYIVGIVPGSSAERCECLQPGDLILKVHNVDVWDIGPEKTEQLLTMFAQKNVRELYLGVRYYTSPSQPVISPEVVENHKTLIAVDVERRASTTDSAQPSSVGTFHPTPFIDEAKESSPSSSQMETPEPLNEVDSRDELNVLTRSIPSPDNQEGIQTDDDTANMSAAKSSIAALRCPVVKEDGNVSATEGEFTDGGHTSGDRSSPSAVLPVDPSSPPPVPPRKFSRDQTQGNSDVPPSPVSTSVDPMKFYKRPDKPGDQILRIEITVPRLPPLMGNGSVHSPELVNASASKTDNLGIRLVGSRIPDCPATFVAGFQPDSIAAQHSDLRVGDEIVQVGQTSVVGLNHLTVLRCISQAMHAINTAKLPLSPPDEKKALPQSFCVIVRRNPLNLQMMAAQGPSSQGNSNLQQPTTPTHRVDDRTVITPDPARDLAPDQPDSSHSVTVDPKFANQIAQELHESLDDLCLFNVEIPRSKDGFGIFIVNFGPNDEPGVFVNDLAPSGAAAKQGELRPHDRILAVNGSIQTDYDATLRLIQQSVPSVRLTVGRPKLILPPASTEPVATSSPTPSISKPSPQKTASPSIPFKPIVPGVETLMELVREDGGGLGFSVVGGKDTVLGGILIHEIHEDGVAARDGRLCAGDHLLAANGVDLRNADHKTAIEIIRAAGSRLQLLVYRDPPSKSVSNEPYILVSAVINRKPGQNLGLSLIGRSPYSTGTAIGDVLKESPAAQCKLLEPGDVILEINDRDVRLAQAQEVVALLKDAVGDVRITVGRSKSSDQPALPPAVPRYRLTLYVVVLNHPSTKPLVESEQKPVFSSEFRGAPLLGPTNSEASFGLYVRQATTEEILDAGGLLIVEELQPDSPASRSDMILPGDRLLTVDREPVDWLRPDEVFGVLAELRSCTLELGRLPSSIYHSEPNAIIPEDGSVPLRLPEVIGGVMPAIEPPKGIREMEILEEEENPESTDFERFLAVKEVEDKNETHSSVVTPSEASSTDIRNAVEMAERGVGGFQMRQISLPPSPKAPKTPRGWLGVELTKRPTLGLRLTNGPGISGPIVVHVQPGSAAAEAGIHVGDRILGLDNTLILALGSDVRQILEMIETSWLSRPAEGSSSSATNGVSKPVCLTIISVPLPSKVETDSDPPITSLTHPCPPPPPPRANLPNGLSTSAKLASVPPTSPPTDDDGEITPVPGRAKIAGLSSAVSKEELRRMPTKV